jgi:hypothetical protein
MSCTVGLIPSIAGATAIIDAWQIRKDALPLPLAVAVCDEQPGLAHPPAEPQDAHTRQHIQKKHIQDIQVQASRLSTHHIQHRPARSRCTQSFSLTVI